MENVEFQLRVRELMPAEHERDTLFEALRRYQSRQDLAHLLSVMRLLLNEPGRLELYDVMRPLILPRHQMEYSGRVPDRPGSKLRSVRIERRGGESLGFCVKGGFEHKVGMFVTEVSPGCQADRRGLRVGDEILRVNGFTISEAIHDDVLSLIRQREEIVLKVTHIGMMPVKDAPNDMVTWEHVDEAVHRRERELLTKELKCFVDMGSHQSFGCGIRSGPRDFPGIFIERVREGSLAEEVGLKTGDQIVQVNDTSFKRIGHKEAVLALKGRRQLNLIILKQVGVHLFSNGDTGPPVTSRGSNLDPGPRPVSDPDLANDLHDMAHLADTQIDRDVGPGQERRDDWQHLDEVDIIQRQLSVMPSLSSSRPTSYDAYRPPERTTVSTSALVHQPIPHQTYHNDNGNGDSRFYGPTIERDSVIRNGSEQARQQNELTTPLRLQTPRGDYEWTDTIPTEVYSQFPWDVLEGRSLQCLTYRKSLPLGLDVEGGIGSPLGGKILVAAVFEGGLAHTTGKVHLGDQLLTVNGCSLVGVSVGEAEALLGDVGGPGNTTELIYCESALINDEDNVTYF